MQCFDCSLEAMVATNVFIRNYIRAFTDLGIVFCSVPGCSKMNERNLEFCTIITIENFTSIPYKDIKYHCRTPTTQICTTLTSRATLQYDRTRRNRRLATL